MYYLDLYKLYKPTEKTDRVTVRKTLNRDAEMSKKLELQKFACFFCGTNIGMGDHLDHLVPIYYGGSNKNVNLVASCKSCNLTKSTQQIEITNEHTINDYLRLKKAYKKWEQKVKDSSNPNRLKRYQPTRVRLYGMYRGDLFRSI